MVHELRMSVELWVIAQLLTPSRFAVAAAAVVAQVVCMEVEKDLYRPSSSFGEHTR